MPIRTRERFEHFYQLHEHECDVVETDFPCHPRQKCGGVSQWAGNAPSRGSVADGMRGVPIKIGAKTRTLKQPDVASLPLEERVDAISEHRLNFYLFEDFSHRFSLEEADSALESDLGHSMAKFRRR